MRHRRCSVVLEPGRHYNIRYLQSLKPKKGITQGKKRVYTQEKYFVSYRFFLPVLPPGREYIFIDVSYKAKSGAS